MQELPPPALLPPALQSTPAPHSQALPSTACLSCCGMALVRVLCPCGTGVPIPGSLSRQQTVLKREQKKPLAPQWGGDRDGWGGSCAPAER